MGSTFQATATILLSSHLSHEIKCNLTFTAEAGVLEYHTNFALVFQDRIPLSKIDDLKCLKS